MIESVVIGIVDRVLGFVMCVLLGLICLINPRAVRQAMEDAVLEGIAEREGKS